MSLRGRALVLLVAGAAAAASAAVAGAGTIVLLQPTAGGTPPPPLAGRAAVGGVVQETRFRGRLRNDERVDVGLAPDGSPVRVVVRQRLVISRPGDFSFTVPAPATAVVAAPGSQAEPGLRDLGIVWQGFSSGRRVLVARATLRRGAAAAGLPLRVSVDREGDRVTVRLTDVAVRKILLASGTASSAAVRDVAARLRTAQLQTGEGVPTPDLLALSGTPAGQVSTAVAAPLRIRGTITVPGRRLPVSEVLGNGRSLTRTISLRSRALPKIALRVEPLDPLELLPTPGEAAAAGDPVSALQHALGRIALSWQFRHFLASPDPRGPSRTVYAYRTLAHPPVAVQRSRNSSGGDETIVIVLAATLGAAALVGAVVLWAHL